MEFGVVGFDGFSSNEATDKQTVTSDFTLDFSPSKVGKLNSDFSPSTNLHLKHSSFVLSDEQQEDNMLSFSSSKLENKNLQNSAFGYFQHTNPSYCKNAGYSSNGGLNARMCYLNGVKWPFTTSQWLELEQQALIYKYIVANEPIPPNLLIPIKRALDSAGFCSFPGGLLRPNTYGWSPFHIGFTNSSDPEPGRCRRTDGKKWRCSRDAVLDQKYCERHINRGRHRSRKPVEAHSGHTLSGTTTNKTNSPSSLAAPGGAASNASAVNHTYSKDLLSVVSNPSRNTTGVDFLSPTSSPSSNENRFSISTQRTSSLYGAHGSSCHDINAQESSILWPKLQSQPERTQLSISISGAPADYRSSTSSPTGEKVTLSPLRLSREIDTVQMGLGLGTITNPPDRSKQPDSGPISWESSVGGPLGEALKTTSNYSVDHDKNLSALHLYSF